MKIQCPNCKEEFDITEIVEPIKRKAIEEYTHKIIKELQNDNPPK